MSNKLSASNESGNVHYLYNQYKKYGKKKIASILRNVRETEDTNNE